MRRKWEPFQTPQSTKAKGKRHKDCLTTAELADKIGRTPYTVRKWRREGVLQATYRIKTGHGEVCLYNEAAVAVAKELAKTRKPGRVAADKAS